MTRDEQHKARMSLFRYQGKRPDWKISEAPVLEALDALSMTLDDLKPGRVQSILDFVNELIAEEKAA